MSEQLAGFHVQGQVAVRSRLEEAEADPGELLPTVGVVVLGGMDGGSSLLA